MSRIEATIATQVGDGSRPRQAIRDVQLQSQQVRTKTITDPQQSGGTRSARTSWRRSRNS